MPRRPDLPCAKCGALMWRGTTSLPDGQATCQPCRKAARPEVAAVEEWVCASCGRGCSRPRTKGQRPKWCPDCRARGAWGLSTFACEGCGQVVTGSGKKFCSVVCSNRAKAPRPKKPKPKPKPKPKRTPQEIEAARKRQRSPLRAALEDGDRVGVLRAIKSHSLISDEGCWLWQRKLKDGYATVNVGGRWHQVHRLSIEARLGAPLGSQHAHHACATPACVNPDHLQPVTHRENVAEMMARQSYLARIRELEEALAKAAPNHPLLSVIAVA